MQGRLGIDRGGDKIGVFVRIHIKGDELECRPSYIDGRPAQAREGAMAVVHEDAQNMGVTA